MSRAPPGWQSSAGPSVSLGPVPHKEKPLLGHSAPNRALTPDSPGPPRGAARQEPKAPPHGHAGLTAPQNKGGV